MLFGDNNINLKQHCKCDRVSLSKESISRTNCFNVS